jgi:hypothetical protein
MPEAPAISPGEDEGLGDESSIPAQSKQEMKQEIQGGRRRGKRRVVKKLTMKDDEGYLSKHDTQKNLLPAAAEFE